MGCAFGRVGCPFCYVRESPVGQFGPAAWGTWVRQKVNIAEVLEQELHKPAARHYRVFMASATDPYQPAEASACLTQRCLAVLRSHPVDWLVVQTRSLLVQRDFALLAELPFATLNVSIETDLLDARRFTRSRPRLSGASPWCAWPCAWHFHPDYGVALLPSSANFRRRTHTAGEKGRVIVDTFLDGDGSGASVLPACGYVPRRRRFPRLVRALPGACLRAEAALLRWLGPERVLWSAEGFRTQPGPAGVSPQ